MNYKDVIIESTISVRESLKSLDKAAKKVLYVIENNKLIGVVSDGDIRRWILKNGSLEENIMKVMNPNPIKIDSKDKLLSKNLMKNHGILSVPVVNKRNEIVWIYYWNDFKEEQSIDKIELPVIIMAGGKGERLLPFTTVVPKPLIPIGEITITERVINSFRLYGCTEFILSLNYKRNMIKAYFNEVEKDYQITYLEESKPLGTGGSLYYLKDKMKTTFIVSNCDILLNVNYAEVYHFHKKYSNLVTMITSMQEYIIPYGVVDINADGSIQKIIEKPQLDYLVNTGVYFIEPEVLAYLSEDNYIHITDLLEKCLHDGMRIGTYPISEDSWMDMGQFEDMKKMKERFEVAL